MNVMAEAHKATKALISSMSAEGQAQVKAERLYARMFALHLKHFHKEYKAMQKPNTKTEAGQKAIRELGAQAFRNQSSVNPYKDGTLAHDLFKDGWIEAKQEHYNSQGV